MEVSQEGFLKTEKLCSGSLMTLYRVFTHYVDIPSFKHTTELLFQDSLQVYILIPSLNFFPVGREEPLKV